MEYTPRRHRQDHESSPNDRIKNNQSSHRLKPHSPITDVQQWLGNTALKQLLTSPNAAMQSLIKQGGSYAALPQILTLLASTFPEEEVHHFSDKLEALTDGQQQAFWLTIINNSSMSSTIDLNAWQRELEKLSQVELKPDEPKREGDIAQLGAYEPPYTSSYQGLLSPYRALWQWLNYKGNKQGKRALLLQLDTLSLSAKQLLLHRLAKGDSLSIKTLYSTLTIKEHEKEWVNWSLIEKQLEQLQSLSQEHIEQQLELIQQQNDELSADDQEQNADSEQLTDDTDLSWLLLLSDAAVADNDPKRDEFFSFHDPEQLSQLLLGTPLSDKGQAAPLQGDQLIYRLLRLEDVSQAKSIPLRDAAVKQLGFASLKAMLHVTAISIAAQFELHARNRKDERYIKLLQRIGLMKGASMPDKEQLLQALQKQFLSN